MTMHTAKPMAAKKRPRRSRRMAVALTVFAVYVVVVLTQLQLELNERRAALEEIDQRIAEQQRENEDLTDKLNNYEKYLEEQVRERGLARPGEIIFQEIPGME